MAVFELQHSQGSMGQSGNQLSKIAKQHFITVGLLFISDCTGITLEV